MIMSIVLFDILKILLVLVTPVVLILVGTVMNIGVIIVFMRKSLRNTLSRNLFCVLVLNQTVALYATFPFNLEAFGIRLLTLNYPFCKVFTFLTFFFCAMSSWLLVLISLERLFFVNYKQIKVFKQIWFQRLVICILLAWNCLVYSGYFNFTNIEAQNNSINDSNNTNFYCSIHDPEAQFLWSSIDLLNSLIVPFILMIICSTGISLSIYRTKRALSARISTNDVKSLNINTRFSVLILSIDMAFFVFNLPICVYDFSAIQQTNNFGYDLCSIFFICQYTVNGFIFFFINLKFKRELLIILRLRKQRRFHQRRRFYNIK